MSWSAVGSEIACSGANTFTFAPSASGNVAYVIVTGQSATVWASTITSTNATWTLLDHFKGTNIGDYVSVFQGVASASTSATATFGWSGTAPTAANIRGGGFVFHSSVGSYGSAVVARIDVNSATWPTAGLAGLNFGYAYNNSTQAATTTSGWTSAVDANGNPWAYNLAATSSSAAVLPDVSPQLGFVVGVAETAAAVTSTGSMGMAPLGESNSAVETISSTGNMALPAFTAQGSASAPVTSTGSMGLPPLGFGGSQAAIPVTAQGSMGMPPLGFKGSGYSGPYDIPGEVDAGPGTVTGALSLGAAGGVSISGGVTANAKAVSGAMDLGASGGSTGPGGSGTGTSGGSASGFDAYADPDWLQVGNDLDPRLELQIGGDWVDFSTRVFDGSQITIQRGHPDESTTAAPSAVSGDIDNHDGVLSTLNPLSPYYGQLGLNTPMRVSIPDASRHLRLEADGAGAFSPAVSVPGSFDIWLDADADNWQGGQFLAGQWDEGAGQCGWILNTLPSGAVEVGISADGVSSAWAYSFPLPKARGRISVRVTYDASSGQVAFYTGDHCQSWVPTAFSTLPSGGAHASSAPVRVGWTDTAPARGLAGFQGKVYAFALLGSIGASIDSAVIAGDFSWPPVTAASWTDPLGFSWSITLAATVSDRDYRFHGEAAAWPQSWTPGDPNARIALSGGGLLRRLGQANTPVASPMYRAYTRAGASADVKDYWSFEDGSNATQLGSAMGGFPFRWSGGAPSLSSFSGFACSAPMLTLNKTSMTATIAPYAVPSSGPGSDAVVRFLLAVPAGGDVSGILARVYYTGGAANYIDLTYDASGGLGLTAYDYQDKAAFQFGPVSFGVNGKLIRVSLELVNHGDGTYTASVVTLEAGASFGLAFGVTHTGAVGAVSRITISPDQLLGSTSVGHVSAEATWTSLFDMAGALQAYASEPAGIRFQRLCAEEGISFRGIGSMADTVPMGVQTVQTLTQLLQECADADRGVWFETRQLLGWGYRSRASLGNQAATVGFDYNQDHLSGTLQPTVDDQVVKNDITVSNSGGSSSRQVLDDGSARSVSRIGRYDTQLTVNLASDALLDSRAGWELHALTVDEPRYPQIECDLANGALGSLYWDALSAEMGDRVTVSNPPVWLPPGKIDQLAAYSSETIGRKDLGVQWTGIPSTPWNVAYADDIVFGRADTDGSQLAAAAGPSDATLSVATMSGPLWTTDPADFPFDVAVGGERITVTSVSGTSSPQAFVVNRAANGVVKSQPAGSDVRLWTPSIISL